MTSPSGTTSFLRGSETFSNSVAMAKAGARRWISAAVLFSLILGCLWTATSLGPLLGLLPRYFLAELFSTDALGGLRETFGQRTTSALLRVTLGRSLLCFFAIFPAIGWFLVRHGGRLMAGRQRRGVRRTTYKKEIAQQKRNRLLTALPFGFVGIAIFLGLWLTEIRLLLFFDYAASAIHQSSDLGAWFVGQPDHPSRVFVDKALSFPCYEEASFIYEVCKDKVFGLSFSALLLILLFAHAAATALAYVILSRIQQVRDFDKGLHKAFDIAGIPILCSDLTKHMITLGAPGSGKSVNIKALLRQVRARQLPALIYDTGEYKDGFYRPDQDVLFWPKDPRSVAWTPFAEIEDDIDASEIAQTLLPTGREGNYFAQAGQDLLKHALLLLKKQGKVRNRDLVELFQHNDLKALHSFFEGTLAAQHLNPEAPKQAQGVIATAMTALESLAMLPDIEPGQEGFSVRRFVKECTPDRMLFFGCNEDHALAFKNVLATFATVGAKALLSLPESRDAQFFVFLDEFTAMGKMPTLVELLARARKYGACCCMGLQNVAQLYDLYGKTGGEKLLGQPQIWLVLRSTGLELKHLAAVFGEQEMDEQRQSVSMGASDHRDGINLANQVVTRPVVLASEIDALKTFCGFFRKIGDDRVFEVYAPPEDLKS